MAGGSASIWFTAAALILLSNVHLREVEGANFKVTNNCKYTVWAAGIPVGGGRELSQGQSWSFYAPAGTSAGRVWGRTECSFDGSGKGRCKTGDCAGVLSCKLSGAKPTTLAEYTLNGGNNQDYYDLSVIDGFNVPMKMTPSGPHCTAPRCDNKKCPEAYQFPEDNTKTLGCTAGNDFDIAFCPS